MEEFNMTREEQVQTLVDRLMDVRRVKNSDDREREIADQERILTVKLEALGFTVADLPEPR